jgi:hypothetical protein
MENVNGNEAISTFEFLIGDIPRHVPMKNIPMSALPKFHGMKSEDLDTFLFGFEIMCQSYDYNSKSQKLKLFPTTLMGAALRWFMGLDDDSITSWDNMKQIFLEKYQESRLLQNKRQERGTLQNVLEGGREFGGICLMPLTQFTEI